MLEYQAAGENSFSAVVAIVFGKVHPFQTKSNVKSWLNFRSKSIPYKAPNGPPKRVDASSANQRRGRI